MSIPSPRATHAQSQHFPSPPDPSELTALAHGLQKTAQALLTFCEKMPPAENEAAKAMPDASGMADSEAGAFELAGETRSYYFSPFTLESERKLLKEYEAEDFRGLLLEAHLSLSGMVELMKNIEMETKLNSTVVYSLGCLLERVSLLVFRIQDAYSTMEPVEA